MDYADHRRSSVLLMPLMPVRPSPGPAPCLMKCLEHPRTGKSPRAFDTHSNPCRSVRLLPSAGGGREVFRAGDQQNRGAVFR